MEKLKNLVNPGSKRDDEVMYGSGRSEDPVHSGSTGTHSGQGSHFGTNRAGDNNTLQSSNNPIASTTGLGSNTAHNPLATSTNSTGSSQYDTENSGRGTAGLHEPYASRMPGGFDDDAATTASVRSGIPGQTTQTGSGMMGSHDPNLTNKPLPHEPTATGSGIADPLDHGVTGGNSLTGQNYPNRSVGNSGLGNDPSDSSHLGRDAGLGAGVLGAGAAARHHHESAQHGNYAPETGRSFPLGGSSNTSTDPQYPSGQSGNYPTGANSSMTTGPHSSNLANKADPRVDSDLDGSHRNHKADHVPTVGITSSSTAHDPSGRDAAIGGGIGAATGGLGSRSAGHGPESWEHDHNKHGHQYEGDPCAPGETTAAGPHFIQGPHATDTANRLDPHVAGGSGPTETVTRPLQDHHDGGAALAGGNTSRGLGPQEGRGDFQDTYPSGSDRSGLGSSYVGSGQTSTGPAPETAGPHKSNMLNKLDPRVDSDLSKQHSHSGTNIGSSSTGVSEPQSSHIGDRDHPRGEGAALGGAGLASSATQDVNRHHGSQATNPGSTLGSSNRYNDSTVDPRVNTGQSGIADTSNPLRGHGRDHHTGRDATLGAGAGGLIHEAERHHGQPTQSSGLSSETISNSHDENTRGFTSHDQVANRDAHTTQQPTATRDHHYGRDAALGAGVGAAAYEGEKHHARDSHGVASTPQDLLAGSGHQPQTQYSGHRNTGGILGSGYADNQPQVGTTSNDFHSLGRDHHVGRDGAVGGAALGAGGVGVDQHQKFHETGRTDHGTSVREHERPGVSNATYPSPGYGNERNLQDHNQHSHRREGEALAGGAAAGGLAQHEISRKDEKALEKEHAKEIKQHDKALEKEHAKEIKQHDKAFEKEHAKDIKHHDKELAKEEKAIEKDEKHHEKERAKHLAAIEKDQKKHEHEREHEHDHQGEKKKGGLLGFLHRDKPDKELKEEEARRQASANIGHDRPAGEKLGAGGAATSSYDPLAGEHGSQSGVHDTPIGTGPTTHDAYGTHEGHNKLHKDPPAKVLEARGQDYQGHGNVS